MNVQAPVIDPSLSSHVNVVSTGPLIVTVVSERANPRPLTATVSPTTPADGDSEMLTAAIVSVEVAVSPAPPTAFPTAVIV